MSCDQKRKHSVRQVLQRLEMCLQLLPEQFGQVAVLCSLFVRRILGFRNGREIDEDEALDRNGIVRDGVAVRTSLMMRDGVSPVQRPIMLDQAITDAARNKHRNLL
jgi:hypothetical protein